MMYPYYGYGDYGYGILGGLLHIIGIVITIVVVVWIVRRILWGRYGGKMMHWRGCWAAHSGLSVLNERYARGEIDKAEYEERKKTLLGE